MASRTPASAVRCVIVVVLVAGCSVASAQTSSSSGIKDAVDVASKIITGLATMLAGAWAYYRFIKGRVFEPRLTLTIRARRLRMNEVDYIASTMEVANVGLSRADIDGADLRVSAALGAAASGSVRPPEYDWLRTVPVLLAHTHIESGEKLTEENLLIVSTSSPVVLDFKVSMRKVSFTATTVVAEPSPIPTP